VAVEHNQVSSARFLQKLDPTQFVRVYGRPAKIHLDPAVAMAAEGPQIMSVYVNIFSVCQ
jgi:hypothetical protein